MDIERRLARSLFTLGALIIIAASTPAGARAQQHRSARIEALGGSAVSGVVPDTLTDIHLNPAYLHRCERLTINYGQRSTGSFSLRFLGMNWHQMPYRPNINPHNETELSLYGLRVGPVRFGLSASWYLDRTDVTSPENELLRYNDRIVQYIEDNYDHRDSHDYRLDLSLSTEIAHERYLGFRIGGYQRTYAYNSIRQTHRYYFMTEISQDDLYPGERYFNYDKNEDLDRVSSFFFQMGILAGEGEKERSILLGISRSELYSRDHDWSVVAYTDYDMFGDPYEYEYDERYYREERSGTLWRYDIRGRLFLPNGIRLFAGGGFEHMAYESNWIDRTAIYEWRDNWAYSEREERTSILFEGDEEYRGFSLFMKGGKTSEISEDLRLTAGLHAYLSWMRAEEDPVTTMTHYSIIDSALINFSMERQNAISIETTEASLNIPLAIEFEPATWVSLWSGFRIRVSYRKERDLLPNIISVDLLGLVDPSLVELYTAREAVRSVEDVEIDSFGTVGASLHYGKRFFIDLYMGTDITPDSIYGMILDVRYTF